MNVTIKSPQEQDKMRAASRLAADVLDMIGEHVKPGITTGELDQICHQYITEVQEAIHRLINSSQTLQKMQQMTLSFSLLIVREHVFFSP